MERVLPWVLTAMMLAGISMLLVGHHRVGLLLQRIPERHLQQRWRILRYLILMFVLGYVCFTVLIWNRELTWAHLLEPGVFFFGALFVMLVCNMSLNTTDSILMVYTLKRETITDPLMGVYNRRHLDHCLDEEIATCRRTLRPLSLMMLDIDHFKRINDSYGHPVGDDVLRALGPVLLTHTRDTDIVARFGGEEVAVLLPNTAHDSAQSLAKRLHEACSTIRIPLTHPCASQQDHLSIEVSIGVATCKPDNANAAMLLKAADLALYQAKHQGRNQVVCHGQVELTADLTEIA